MSDREVVQRQHRHCKLQGETTRNGASRCGNLLLTNHWENNEQWLVTTSDPLRSLAQQELGALEDVSEKTTQDYYKGCPLQMFGYPSHVIHLAGIACGWL